MELKNDDYLNNQIANYYIDHYIQKNKVNPKTTYNFLNHIYNCLLERHSFDDVNKMFHFYLYFHINMIEVKNDVSEFMIIKKYNHTDKNIQIQGKLQYIKYNRMYKSNKLKTFKKLDSK